MKKRIWLGTGIVEILDKRQTALLDLVLSEVRRYYEESTRYGITKPLNLTTLAKRCQRSHGVIINAVRLLANSVEVNQRIPPLTYKRLDYSQYRRPYVIQILIR